MVLKCSVERVDCRLDENTLICEHWASVKETRVFKSKIAYFLFKNELEEKDVSFVFTLCLTHKHRGQDYSVSTSEFSPQLSLYDILRRRRFLEFPTITVRLLQPGDPKPQSLEANKSFALGRRRPFKLEHSVFTPSLHLAVEQTEEAEKEEREEEEEEEDIDPAERKLIEKEIQSLLSLLT
jgi:hypothetical protein